MCKLLEDRIHRCFEAVTSIGVRAAAEMMAKGKSKDWN